MKIFILTFILICFNSYAIVPNTQFYIDAEERIAHLEVQLIELKSNLSTQSATLLEVKLKLKMNIENEIRLIKEKIKLFKQLERNSLIMYSNT